LDRDEHGDQFRGHRYQPLAVGLAGHDVQQWHERAGGGGGVVAKRQLSQFEQFLDPDPGVAKSLDHHPGPEPIGLQRGDVDQAADVHPDPRHLRRLRQQVDTNQHPKSAISLAEAISRNTVKTEAASNHHGPMQLG
jgi:hypothetical protein